MLNLKKRAHVLISGKVQRVYFRGYTKNEAQKHDLKGWVRNLSDGRVEAVFEGENDEILKLIKKIGVGPSHAEVENLNISWENFKGEFADFQIYY